MTRIILLVALLAGCATPGAPRLDATVVASSFTGCWEGRRADGRLAALRIEPADSGVRFDETTPTCATRVSRTDPMRVAYHLQRGKRGVEATTDMAGSYYGWTVTAPSAGEIMFTPSTAPVWMRLKQATPDRIEWSRAGRYDDGRSYIDPVILTRAD